MTSADLWNFATPAFVGFGGGLLALVVGLPSKIGERLVGFSIDKKFQTFKDSQNEKLEMLKEQLNHLGDRGKRSNEMEFAAIRAVWDKFVEAYLAAQTCALEAIEYPNNINQMTDAEIADLLKSSDVSEENLPFVLSAPDRSKAYLRVVQWSKVVRAGVAVWQTRLELRKQRIFMPATLQSKFSESLEALSRAYVQKKLEHQHQDRFRPASYGPAADDLVIGGEKLFEDLAQSANLRLFRHETP